MSNQIKKIYIGSDHAGFDLKEQIKKYYLHSSDVVVVDIGPSSDARVDYPDYAEKLCKDLINDQENKNAKGILICGSGIGVSMVANKFRGIKAALCRSVEDARLSREHNDSNVLCIGARVSDWEIIEAMIEVWLNTDFLQERHALRVEKFVNLGTKL